MFKVMLRLVSLLVGIMFGAVQRSGAGDDEPSKSRRRWKMLGYFTVEDMSRIRLAVCDWLERRGSEHSCDLASSGGGATVPVGPLLIDVSGVGIRDHYHDDRAEHTFRGSSGGASIGIPVINTRMLRIYPLVGAGGMRGKLDVNHESEPGWVALFFTTGIGVDLCVKLLFFDIVVGLRAGYHHEIATMQLGDGPDYAQPGGLFLRFVVGP